MGNYGNPGDIEQLLSHAKSKCPGDLEGQGKYLQIATQLIKRDYGSEVKVAKCDWNDYEVVCTMFPSGGYVYVIWELFKYGSCVGVGLEKMDPNTNSLQLLFSSTSIVKTPILSDILSR